METITERVAVLLPLGAAGQIAVAPVLEHVHPSTVAPVEKDIKNRDGPSYREFLERLIADIRIRGVHVPLICYRGADGRIYVIDGETRRQAALMAGAQTCPVLIYANRPSNRELEVGKLLANTMRLDMNALERAAAYISLMALNGWSAAELARHIHVSPAQVTKDLAISRNLCDAAKALVASGELAVRAAYHISRLPDVPTQIDLAEKVKKGILSVEACESHVGTLLNGRQKRAKPVKIKLRNGTTITIPGNISDSALSDDLITASDANKRREKNAFPLATLPSLLKSPS